MRDMNNHHVKQDAVFEWYLTNINKPEAVGLYSDVHSGMLCNVEDSPFKQGYEAGKIGIKIILNESKPGQIGVLTPDPGPSSINKKRAKKFGIDVNDVVVDKIY